MKLFNRQSKKETINKLENEVKHLQSQLENAQVHFENIKEITEQIGHGVDEIEAITKDDIELKFKLFLLGLNVNSLNLELINENQDRIRFDLQKGGY